MLSNKDVTNGGEWLLTLKNQLAAQGRSFSQCSTQLTPPKDNIDIFYVVSLVDINPINSSAYKEGRTIVVGCENDASIQKSNGLATLEKEMETRDTPKGIATKVSIETSLVDAAMHTGCRK
ncbi:hypothetical protein Tco_0133930 [Tanacetum coccineum]